MRVLLVYVYRVFVEFSVEDLESMWKKVKVIIKEMKLKLWLFIELDIGEGKISVFEKLVNVNCCKFCGKWCNDMYYKFLKFYNFWFRNFIYWNFFWRSN